MAWIGGLRFPDTCVAVAEANRIIFVGRVRIYANVTTTDFIDKIVSLDVV
jgi:hypothetical protein